MNLHIGQTTATGSGKELRKQLIAAACGVTLTTAALAGIGAWSASGGTSHGSARTSEKAPVQAVAVVDRSAARPAQPVAYYLVGSQQQADSLRFGLDNADLNGPVAPNALVKVVGSPEEEAQLRQAIADADLWAAGFGAEGPQLEDLRTSRER